MWYPLSTNVRNEFGTALDVDDATWLSRHGCVLSQALTYLRHHNDSPKLAKNARHVLRDVLAAPR